MKRLFSIFVLCSFFAGGCAYTHIFSRNNPDVAPKRYSAILIIANVPGMELQTNLEEGLTHFLQLQNLPSNFFQRSHTIFQVTPLTNEEIESICEKNSCDGVIFIGMEEPKTSDYNIDLGSTTTGTIKPQGFGAYSYTSRTTNQSFSGTITTFNATVDFVDLETGKLAWHSEEQVTTGALGSWDQAIDSFLTTVANEMKQNFFIE
jgi:hypothetical protein